MGSIYKTCIYLNYCQLILPFPFPLPCLADNKPRFVAFDKHVFKLGDDEQTDIMMKLTLEENNAGANISMTSDRSADPVSEEICVTNQSSSDAQSDPSGT